MGGRSSFAPLCHYTIINAAFNINLKSLGFDAELYGKFEQLRPVAQGLYDISFHEHAASCKRRLIAVCRKGLCQAERIHKARAWGRFLHGAFGSCNV